MSEVSEVKARHCTQGRLRHGRYRQTAISQVYNKEMTAEQRMTQIKTQAAIQAAKTAIMTVRETDNLVSNARPVHTMPGSGSPVLKQLTFDWKVADKY